MATRTSNSGTDWLASCAPDPVQVHRAWDRDELALVRSGTLWVAVEAAITSTVTAMQRIGPGRLGPVLVYPSADRAWWLLSPGAEDLLADLPQLFVHPAGWALRCPPADRYVDGLGWLEKPDGSGRLTEPAALGAAFGPAGTMRHPAGSIR
ncbi:MULTISPECIES: hypothetical protein [unclassified Streptomyces]|uniref:hypothetical protein n=1 Tax=unclassified Streptomyces TaxID=2593676 RepID=UPI000BEF4BBD|nr:MULTISPECIES: hypothetical protein [unclassified Streptomyces]